MSALECAEVLPHLESYRRGDCSGELSILIDEHIGQCPRCQRQLAHLKRLTAMLSAWRPRRVGAGLKMEIAEAISEPAETEARKVYGAAVLLRPRRRDFLKFSTYQRLANGIALAALVFLAAAILWRVFAMQPGQPARQETTATGNQSTPQLTQFEVLLIDTGLQDVSVVRLVQELVQADAAEAEGLVKRAAREPIIIKSGLSQAEAEEIVRRFAAVGARAEAKGIRNRGD